MSWSQGNFSVRFAGFWRGKRTATVTALVPCEVLILSADQLQRGFTDSPDLLRKTLQVLAGRTRRIADRQMAYREEHKALREVQRSLLPILAAIDSHGRFRLEASGNLHLRIRRLLRRDSDRPERFLFAVGDVMGQRGQSLRS